MSIITLDFETYFDDHCSLKRLETLDYLSHPDFKVHMLGIKEDHRATSVLTCPQDISEALEHYFHPGNKNTLLAHNTAFDGLIIEKGYGLLAHRYADTQLMFKGLAPYMSTSLDSMTKAIFPNDPTKQKGKELIESKGVRNLELMPKLHKSIINYCANDVDLTYDCFMQMLQFFPVDELKIIHYVLDMWINPKFRLDSDRVTRHLALVQEQTTNAIKESGLTKTILSSNPKFADWIESQGMDVPMKINAKGKETFALAKNDIPFTQLQNKHPEHQAVWDARAKVKSTIDESRAKRLLNNAELDEGWLRVPLKYYGALTGRFSGAEKINLQNLKRGSELRRALIAPEGKLVYVSDLSQIEARMNAWLAGETELVEDFRRGVDIYSKFAGDNIYHRHVDRKREEVDENGKTFCPDYIEGFVGKVCILGLGYGMSGDKFRLTLASGSMGASVFFSPEEADDIVYKGYRRTYKNIVRSWKTADRHIRGMMDPEYDEMWGPMRVMYRRIILPNGMCLNYPELRAEEFHDGSQQFEYWNGKFFTNIYGGKLVENVVQALARIVVMDQALKIMDEMPELEFALQVHDELIFTGPEEDPDPRFKKILGYMHEPPAWCSDLPVAAEGGYAKDYSK